MKFMIAMIIQLIQGLKQLHGFGYSHGDLKLENICARPGKDGIFKFTLIDLGVASKLPRIGENTQHKNFRGNLLTASPDHIKNRRAGAVDDFYSLLCVAYYFVFETLPWRKVINEYLEIHRDNVEDKKKLYIKLRKQKKEEFDQELINDGLEL